MAALFCTGNRAILPTGQLSEESLYRFRVFRNRPG
jgi:hypothetical protein